MKIELNYEPLTGQITNDIGVFIATCAGLNHLEVKSNEKEQGSKTDVILKLKDAGFSADDIMAMSSRGVI